MSDPHRPSPPPESDLAEGAPGRIVGRDETAPADLDQVLAAIDVAALFLDRSLRVVRFTPRLGDLFDVQPHDRGRRLADVVCRLHYEEFEADASAVLERPVPIEREVRGEGGRWYLTRVLPNRSAEGRVEGVVLTCVEIPGRRQTERALLESEERYRTLFESIDEGFCIIEVLFDAAGEPEDYRFLEVNPAFEAQTGLSDAVGRRIKELAPEHEAHWFETYGRIARTGTPERFSAAAAALDNRWYDVYAFRLGEPEGRKVAVLFVDVGEKRRAEQALRKSEERFRTLAETVPDVVFTASAEGVVDYVNPQHEAMTGVSAEDVVGTVMWPDLVHPDDRAAAEAAWAEARDAERQFETRYRVVSRDGDSCWVIVRARPIVDDAGVLVRWFGTVTDVDALMRAEAEVRQLNATLEERVETRTAQVRDLARALTLAEQTERRRIAHVLHDDLQPTLAGAQIAAAQGELARLEAILDQAIGITRTLSHELSPPLLRDDNFAGLLDWLVEKKRDDYGLAVELDVRGDVSVPEADLRVLLYQLLRELLFNVVKHAETRAARVVAERDGDLVRIVVEDEGAGFDAHALATEAGSGLGLPSVRERLELVGGTLAIETAPGQGTRVTMTIPSAPV